MLDTSWTTIATRPRSIPGRQGDLIWSPIPNAPLEISDAHRLAADGEIVMASRHHADVVELVVRQAGKATKRAA